MILPALTLTQPWATLVALGAKRIETRDWPAPPYLANRRLAIHAGKNLGPVHGMRGLKAQVAQEPFRFALLNPKTPYLQASDLPRGVVLGTVVVKACVPTEQVVEALTGGARPAWLEAGVHELSFGNYDEGRWAWCFSDLEVYDEPVPAVGHQKVWTWRTP